MHWREVDLRVEELPAPELDDPARLAAALGVDGIVGGRVADYAATRLPRHGRAKN